MDLKCTYTTFEQSSTCHSMHLVIDEAGVVNGDFSRSHINAFPENKCGHCKLLVIIDLLSFQGLQSVK